MQHSVTDFHTVFVRAGTPKSWGGGTASQLSMTGTWLALWKEAHPTPGVTTPNFLVLGETARA